MIFLVLSGPLGVLFVALQKAGVFSYLDLLCTSCSCAVTGDQLTEKGGRTPSTGLVPISWDSSSRGKVSTS
jgi:hypothetical protein